LPEGATAGAGEFGSAFQSSFNLMNRVLMAKAQRFYQSSSEERSQLVKHPDITYLPLRLGI
jgi:hypothetical protein